MNNRLFLLSICAMALLVLNPFRADAMDLKQRLAILKGLKIKGIVGENNKGYLEFRGKKTAEKIVNEENANRKKVYQDIATKQGVDIEKVGKQRALQNAENSPKGTWIQKADGTWDRK